MREIAFHFESRGLSKVNRQSNQSAVFPQKAANFLAAFLFSSRHKRLNAVTRANGVDF